ncbi:calreticulin [Echinococcus multilocularis]|uniref:Calreticulin n=1 Tax=Echinococcus multilocularis TaxID=6211 RepID=A0A068Y3H4_ECHMU|nr:calreticulin [Echinococcus multilocularis]
MRSTVAFLLTVCLTTVSCKIYFEDRFLDGNINQWTISEAEAEKLGKCEFGKYDPAYDEEDGGMNTTESARFYRYSAPLKTPFSNKDKSMCVQFSVKYAQGIECAGGYIKLLGKDFKPKEFTGETPYEIMFGPDFCGYSTRLVHVIFSHDGKNYLIKESIPLTLNNISHLFTLIVHSNNTFEVKVDEESRRNGSLVDDFDILKPRTIDDPDVKKPEDWVEEVMIPDPEDKKPDDWDQPETIVDTNATKPADWNDEMDGDWSPPIIDNPDYKGEWSPRTIPNPAYKGPWKPPQIPNPEFVDNPDLYSRTFSYIGLDLWQVQSGTLFDNFIISDDLSECEAHAKHWRPRFDAETEAAKKAEAEETKTGEGVPRHFQTSSNFDQVMRELAKKKEEGEKSDTPQEMPELEIEEETVKKPHEEL